MASFIKVVGHLHCCLLGLFIAVVVACVDILAVLVHGEAFCGFELVVSVMARCERIGFNQHVGAGYHRAVGQGDSVTEAFYLLGVVPLLADGRCHIIGSQPCLLLALGKFLGLALLLCGHSCVVTLGILALLLFKFGTALC